METRRLVTRQEFVVDPDFTRRLALLRQRVIPTWELGPEGRSDAPRLEPGRDDPYGNGMASMGLRRLRGEPRAERELAALMDALRPLRAAEQAVCCAIASGAELQRVDLRTLELLGNPPGTPMLYLDAVVAWALGAIDRAALERAAGAAHFMPMLGLNYAFWGAFSAATCAIGAALGEDSTQGSCDLNALEVAALGVHVQACAQPDPNAFVRRWWQRCHEVLARLPTADPS